MFVDAFTNVSSSQALTATAYSTNTIDIEDVRDIGVGEPVGFGVAVEVAADITTGDETYQFDVVQSVNANLSSHDVLLSIVRTAAALTAGELFFVPIPMDMVTKRYIGLRFVLGGTTPTVTVSAWLTKAKDFSENAQAYPKNYAV
jgi:hypothetical protein